MEKWRKVWREAIAQELSIPGLTALQKALETDDSSLVQGKTVVPVVDHMVAREVLCRGACAIGYCGWKGHGRSTVGEVSDYFQSVNQSAFQHTVSSDIDTQDFISWFDLTPREAMRQELLKEVTLTLESRVK